jgi:hypothetical protein
MPVNSKTSKTVVLGRSLSVLAALPFCMSATMKVIGGPQMDQGWAHFGWPSTMVTTIAILEASSVILYLIPRTAVLGAIVLTGYLGGAIATHLRIGEAVYLHVVIGLLIWGGLYLREARLHPLLPLRNPA